MRVNIRLITVGHVHDAPGNPAMVAELQHWLMENRTLDFPPLDVRAKDNGTYRIHDGWHRFLAYGLAERETVPIEIGR